MRINPSPGTGRPADSGPTGPGRAEPDRAEHTGLPTWLVRLTWLAADAARADPVVSREGAIGRDGAAGYHEPAARRTGMAGSLSRSSAVTCGRPDAEVKGHGFKVPRRPHGSRLAWRSEVDDP